MANNSSDFRGVGWAFPVEADAAGRLALARLDESIRESILIIIGTAQGERLMRPTFGCGIHELVFAPNDDTTAGLLMAGVREALIQWEPRISVLEVEVTNDEEDGNKLIINLKYRVRSTNNVRNLVYPFYLEKGRPA